MKPHTLSLVDRSNLGICLMNIVSAQFKPDSPEFAALARNGGVVEVRLTLNGVEVADPVGALNEVIAKHSEEFDRVSAEKALAMVSEAGLSKVTESLERLRDTVDEAADDLRRTLREKAGARFD